MKRIGIDQPQLLPLAHVIPGVSACSPSLFTCKSAYLTEFGVGPLPSIRMNKIH